MPIGCSSCVPYVAAELEKRNPNTILDLGIGMGLYGAVVRQWLDRGVHPYSKRLIGVEGWVSYRNPCWSLYDEVHVESIPSFLSINKESFDAILMMDVIEHFEHGHGLDLIEKMKSILTENGILIIATPAIWMAQGAAYGNDYETHRSLWTVKDFDTFTIITDGKSDNFGHQMILASYARIQS